MTPLVAKLVFVASSALGAASLGSAAYLTEHPRAFSPEPVRSLVVDPVAPRPSPPLPINVPEPAGVAPVVFTTPVVVTGSKAPLIAKARPSQKRATPAATKTLVPCTTWQNMGPKNVNDGAAVGERWVRTLCSK
jgi:hypothetical protein